jgi:hypothetical protein
VTDAATIASAGASGTSPARQGLVLTSLILVAACVPKDDDERRLLAEYAASDAAPTGARSAS